MFLIGCCHCFTERNALEFNRGLFFLKIHLVVNRWRLRIRKALSSAERVAAKTTDVEDDTKGNEDDRLLSEMEELTYALERKKKKAKKRLAKRQAKVG